MDGQSRVRRGQDRATTAGAGTTTRHALSYGSHHDPANTAFGSLVLHDEHLLDPHTGFAEHPHRGLEVVSWVLEGALLHEDDHGGRAAVAPGTVQVLSTGTGVRHAERAGHAPLRFVQAWLVADEPLGPPRHAVHDASGALAGGGLVAVAGEGAPLALRCAGARLSVARLAPGSAVSVPATPLVHLHVAVGEVALPVVSEVVVLGAVVLGAGDAVRLRDGPARRLVAGASGAELLVWELPATPRR